MLVYNHHQCQYFAISLMLMKKRKEWLENLARNLKKERKKLNMSQQDLAVKAKLSIATIAHIEQRRFPNPTLDTIDCLAYALKKSNPLDLFKVKNPRNWGRTNC